MLPRPPLLGEIESSHVPMLSHPDIVLDVIRASANSVMAAKSAAAE